MKKYFPLIALLAAVLLFIWIKTHQRGNTSGRYADKEHSIPAIVNLAPGSEPFNRNTNNLSFSKHAHCRMDCRHIDESEVNEILQKGVVNYNKIEESEKGKSYPLEGITHDKQHVRVVFAPHENELVVITVIDLDRDWPCDCN